MCRETITIAQSAKIGTPLFTVRATDNDLINTPNSAVTFELVDSSLPFSIDPILGNISVSAVIPFPGEINISVRVLDMGTPQLTSAGLFVVTVAPPNFDTPAFPANLVGSFNENDVPASVVLEFTVTDDDSDEEGQVTLTLIPSDFSAYFFLTQTGNTGQLYVNSSFDREQVTNFTLPVLAVDNGNLLFRRSSEAEISIMILDVNDNQPMFIDAPYSVSVSENASTGYSVFQVSARDADEASNAEITFRLDSGSEDFSISSVSGEIVVERTLLRATTGFYMIDIIAEDNGSPRMSSLTYINVTVTEVNDNRPEFDPLPQENITIPENTAPGFVLTNVSVSDADTGTAGLFDLSLSQTGSVFALDGYSLLLNSAVDYEVCQFVH